MKRLSIIFAALSAAASAGLAQTNQTDVLIGGSAVTVGNLDRYIQFQTRTVDRVFGINLNYGGVLPMASQTEKPLHLINPLAAPEYGDGLHNVSVNPHSGRAEGIYLFSIRF